MLTFILVVFIVAGIAGAVTGILIAFHEDKTYRLTHTKEEYRRWVKARGEQVRKERADYWNGPMTRADWFIWGLSDKD